MIANGLPALEGAVARDLTFVDYPNTPWMPVHPAGAYNVLIVGGGQGGLAVAAQLMRDQIRNILVVDESAAGKEGIWTRYARMETLRTPKHIGGPDMGIPSLTFRAWYEAQHGAAAFAAIKYIPRALWQDYLGWFRRVLAIPVTNATRFVGVRPQDGMLVATLVDGEGGQREVLTRKLVLAGGIETSGKWWMPPEIVALPDAMHAHSADPIDFPALANRDVVVIGAGASAFDNAATALEHGAQVTMLCRRAELQRIQPYKVLAFSGFLAHFGTLPDADRWRTMAHLLTVREALTAETWTRVTRQAGFTLVTGAPVLHAKPVDGRAQLRTPVGTFVADFVIAATGFEMDLTIRPELAGVAEHVATWGDRYQPPEGEANSRLMHYPYLDEGMAFTEKQAGTAPWIRNIHCFNFGATASFGPSGSSISAMKFAARRVADAIAGSLFRADFAHHEAAVRDYAVPEFDMVFARDMAQPAII